MIKKAQNKIQSTEQCTTQRFCWAYKGDLSMSLIPEMRLSEGCVPFYVRWQSPCVHAREDRRGFTKLAAPSPSPLRLPYQTFVRMQAAVAARLWNMRRIAQHPSVARLIHPTGGAPRVTAVMAICKGQRKPWLFRGTQPCLIVQGFSISPKTTVCGTCIFVLVSWLQKTTSLYFPTWLYIAKQI